MTETDYSEAYTDAFLVGSGMTVTAGIWAVIDGGLAPLVVAGLTVPLMLFVLPWFLVSLNQSCGLPPSRGPQQ